jgi:hypothetical protein
MKLSVAVAAENSPSSALCRFDQVYSFGRFQPVGARLGTP